MGIGRNSAQLEVDMQPSRACTCATMHAACVFTNSDGAERAPTDSMNQINSEWKMHPDILSCLPLTTGRRVFKPRLPLLVVSRWTKFPRVPACQKVWETQHAALPAKRQLLHQQDSYCFASYRKRAQLLANINYNVVNRESIELFCKYSNAEISVLSRLIDHNRQWNH